MITPHNIIMIETNGDLQACISTYYETSHKHTYFPVVVNDQLCVFGNKFDTVIPYRNIVTQK